MALGLAEDSDRHGAVDSGPVPGLADAAIAPAVHRPRRSEGAGMPPARADRGEARPARDARGGGATVDPAATVTALVFRIPPPAVRRPAGRETAGVIAAASQRDEREPAAHSHGGGPHRRGPVAELAEAVIPPAVRHPAGSETAGVKAAGADRGEGEPPGHGDGIRAGAVRTVDQLAGVVPAPAVRRPAGGQTASMTPPRAPHRQA